VRASAARHHEALVHCHQVGERPGVATALDALGGLATLDGDAVHAARLFGAAQAICDALGHVRAAPWRAEYEADVARARDALSAEDFDAAWAEGAALEIDEAVAYATRGRGERGRPSSGWASLTPAELDVVRLVAEGLTNPQVGERLFISRRTVQTHLAHIFAKLGISTRHELTKLAAQRAR
jgi:DNA-binding CsgD family transcriptional regulator